MQPIVCPGEGCRALLKALGLENRKITRLTLWIEMDQPVRIQTTELLDMPEKVSGEVHTKLKEYLWVEREQWKDATS